ncbi:hypothetical protein GCM10023083_70990 [Streptomyces phyllanthi]
MAERNTGRSVPFTQEEVLALPAVVSIPVANRAFGLGRSMGYELAKRGKYPCKVVKVGRGYRVVTADLLRVLEIGSQGVAGLSSEALSRAELGLAV